MKSPQLCAVRPRTPEAARCQHISTRSFYRIGQLYMISKHSMEESSGGEGIEVIHNEPHQDPVHGTGQYTEKRIYISSKLPAWVRSFVPKIFYITEKAWNYYPFTVTGAAHLPCSFLPKFHIQIETKFESNRGDNANVFQDKPTPSSDVVSLDIAFDEVPERQYKECEDLRTFHSVKTGRGPLQKDWQETTEPIMCSYKRVKAAFEVYGFQGRVENFVHKNIKDILLTGHRQAVAWIDEWFDMSLEDVRTFEKDLQQKTNSKVKSQSKSEWLHAVQALMMLSVFFASAAFLVFLCQLYAMQRGGLFYTTGIFQIFSGLTVFSAALIYSIHSPEIVNSTRGRYGYCFYIAWMCCPLLLVSGSMYIHLRKKK
ncbi:PITC1 protein, partial [Polypterus senegalus]|nr:PITC1 protein [Polypterus senegalus]